MRLQKLVWTVPQNTDTTLYYRKYDIDGKTVLVTEDLTDGVQLNSGECIRFDTYFNSFSIGKWKKYTKCSGYYINVQGNGCFRCKLYGVKGADEQCLLKEQELELKESKGNILEIPDTDCLVCYPVFESLKDKSSLDSVEYHGNAESVRDISLAIDICTFKREPYLKRNLAVLERAIIKNPDSPLYNRVEVFVSDNACSLEDQLVSYSHVHVFPNENVGGVGGFTRGMIEAMQFKGEKTFTHILIMDDDAVIEPASLERMYAMLANLKEAYYNTTIGGGLLRENTPYVQFESGASWNRGKIVAHHHHYDLRNFDEVVANEMEETVEYTGWWYTAIPIEQITKKGLPIPLFIHRDDIEYGLRTGDGNFILLNGIAVWHEAFENKMPGATEYYDLRNLAIVNSIHYPDYSKQELKRFLRKWVIANIVRYRYDYVAMNLLGIRDFLKGMDWFKEQDGQALHQQIMAMNYKAKPAKEYIGYQGIGEEDIRWEHLEQVHARRIGKLERVFKLMSMNGYLFPSKGILIARPHNNIYDLFRKGEVLYVDAAGNALLLSRDRRKAWECYQKLQDVMKEIDRNFEQARKEYQTRYQELTTPEFWKKYLKIE